MRVIAGKYEVIRELGKGSYGQVFLVRHRDLGVRYALKILNSALSDSGKFIERFKREAEILLRFSHPGVTQLRDFGRTEDGRYYMATDFCEGRVLEDILKREKWFPVLKVLEYMLQILDVLEAAHALNIVHRDIKPANVMIETDADGRQVVKILDFGVAKISAGILGTGNVTGEGVAVGTPEYMSPEQASGEDEIDHLSDIYACGILMFELITGEPPFKGQSIVQSLLKHLTQPPPSFAARLGIPHYIEEIVLKALAKERERRYQHASEFYAACLDALARIRREGTGLSRTPIVLEVGDLGPASPLLPVETGAQTKTKILCLDDNEMILQIVSHIFEREGYEVFTSGSFSEIHDYIFKKGVKLMLCDVAMPGLPGNKICQLLKRSVKDLKVVLFSNMNERELEKLCAECEADAWVSKNKKPAEWLAKVQEVRR